MQSEFPDTPERSTWSGQDQEDGQQTDDITMKSLSNPSGTTSQIVTHEDENQKHLDYATSVAGRPVSNAEAEQFINDLEEWYDTHPSSL